MGKTRRFNNVKRRVNLFLSGPETTGEVVRLYLYENGEVAVTDSKGILTKTELARRIASALKVEQIR